MNYPGWTCGPLVCHTADPQEPPLSPKPVPVAILGAGLTGLSAAFHLRAQGVDCRLLERLPHPGGHAITIEEQGYRFDRTGHLLHLRDPSMRALALGWIRGGHLDIERRSRVFSHGVYTRYPFQANTFGLPPEVAFACVNGFVQASFAKDKPAPKSFEDFCRIHFGDAISDAFMIPYNTKLWGVPPSEISAAWCSRFVPIPRVEDVLAGAVGLNDRELGYNARFTYPRLGIGKLVDGLAEAAGPIELERAPVAIDPRARTLHLDGETLRYDTLVSTMPLPALVALLTDAPPAVRDAAARLRCTRLHYLDIALHRPCALPYHWIYVPEPKYPFYRVGSYSNFSAAMAPPNKGSLYVELSDRAPPDLPALLPQIAAHLQEMGLIDTPHAVRFARARTIEHAYVIFDDHHEPALRALMSFLREARILSYGRYGGWNYSSMEDALLFGRDAAREASQMLGATAPMLASEGQ
ncbi:MAG: NAD(P)-binding protein [Polyangiaceae bacterium]